MARDSDENRDSREVDARDAQYDLIQGPVGGTLAAYNQDQEKRAAETEEVVDQLKKDFVDRNELYEEVDKAVFLQNEVAIPEAYKATSVEVRSPLPTHIVNTVAAALSVNPPSVQFEPIGFGDAYMINATLREHFFEASWRRQEHESGRRLFRLFMHALATKGEAVLKTMQRTKRAWGDYQRYSARLDKELEEDEEYEGFDEDAKRHIFDTKTEEYKRTAPYPIVTTDVLPETFYYIKGEDGFTYCCEDKEVPYYETLTKYDASIDRRGRVVKGRSGYETQAMGLAQNQWSRAMEGTKRIRMVEAWNLKSVRYLLYGPGQLSSVAGKKYGRGTIVKEVKHGYGNRSTGTLRGPYFHALGITTAARLPDKAGLGVLYGYLQLFKLLDSLLTIQGNAAFLYGFGSFKRVTPGNQLALPPFGRDAQQQQSDREKVQPGMIFPYDVQPIDMPRGGPDLDKMLQNIRQFIELALPSVVQGMINGDESGYALNQAAHLAKLAWDPIIDNAQFALGDRVGFESWLIENKIKEKVYAWGEQIKQRKGVRSAGSSWLGLDKEDTRGIHRYGVRLDPETPSNKVIETRHHKEMLALRLEYPDQAIEATGGNPDEVERGWLLWELKQDPEIRKKLRDRVLQHLSTIDQRTLTGTPQQADLTGGQGGDQTGMSSESVFHPGNGMPMQPTPQGSVTGVGPAGRQLARGGVGAAPGMPSGQSGIRAAPVRHVPVPGE